MSLAEGVRGAAARNGGLVPFEGEEFLRIAGYDRMPPFLMSLPSDTDLWMFVSSAGGLTAGRTDADGSLFPYVTVDQLHDAHHHTGPVTLLRVRRGAGPVVDWEPFAAEGRGDRQIVRHLYKHPLGTPLVFEEIHHGLGLAFRYRWSACDAFGHVRTATLENRAGTGVEIRLLDGVRGLLPFGAPLALYQHSSSLVDAYKRSEADRETGLGIYSLTSRISDRAEAAEELRANVAWSVGLPEPRVVLSAEAVAAFRRGEDPRAEHRLNGRRGNYLVTSTLALEPAGAYTWHVVADAARDHLQIAALRERLRQEGDGLAAAIEAALGEAATSLRRIVASADGLQLSADAAASVHHFANVLFNNMRGGVFARHHFVPAADLAAFVRTRNRPAAERHAGWLAALPAELTVDELGARAAQAGDPDLERLALEYLPLHFGRRHGDPSRPWNRFTIRVREADGSQSLRYEGNWRDIFQNWEALAASYPAFLPGLIAKFVNASTVDGFNPYRITRDGIDWEVEEPGHPWSNIGYWGDHQIVYLLKFLEALRDVRPGALEAMLDRPSFAYAHVPYRLAPFERMVEDPRATIRFDHALAARIAERERALGTDGRLLPGPEGRVLHVTLFEKLLVPVLSKLSSFVPGAGIWMNTQRPEWNDANNALVGHGVSVVTLGYLRRMLVTLLALFESRRGSGVPVSREVADWARELARIFARPPVATSGAAAERERLAVLTALGRAFTDYRERTYAHGFSGTVPLPVDEALALLRDALAHVDETLRASEREDGLVHAYNLLEFGSDGAGIGVRRLPEMLEGQVAALSSGLIEPAGAVRLLDALFASRLYRSDQDSFMLYPEKTLPGFLAGNAIAPERFASVPLLAELLAAGETSIVARDAGGTLRFAADLSGEGAVRAALDRLAREPRWRAAVERDRAAALELYESVFDHHAFTGRSGTMYGYEGIGSIYWHMVAKLLLAVQETFVRAEREGAPAAVREALARHYERVRGGLGFSKSAEDFGAFPTDPYSHTPAGRGAQQPGMTGQVKEEILTRLGELGVRVEAGRVVFRPRLLAAAEFLTAPGTLDVVGHDGATIPLAVPAGALAFTCWQVPVRYLRVADGGAVRVTYRDGRASAHAGDTLDAEASRSLLERRGEIVLVEVGVPDSVLRRERGAR